MLSQQRRSNQGGPLSASKTITGAAQKQRPSSSKPISASHQIDMGGLAGSGGQQDRPASTGGLRPGSPATNIGGSAQLSKYSQITNLSNKHILTPSFISQLDGKKPRIRSSSPAVQTGPGSTKVKSMSTKGVPGGAINNSFTAGVTKQIPGMN